MPTPQMNLGEKRYDSETQEVARIAKSIQTKQPDISWGECIRLAEKAIREQR